MTLCHLHVGKRATLATQTGERASRYGASLTAPGRASAAFRRKMACCLQDKSGMPRARGAHLDGDLS